VKRAGGQYVHRAHTGGVAGLPRRDPLRAGSWRSATWRRGRTGPSGGGRPAPSVGSRSRPAAGPSATQCWRTRTATSERLAPHADHVHGGADRALPRPPGRSAAGHAVRNGTGCWRIRSGLPPPPRRSSVVSGRRRSVHRRSPTSARPPGTVRTPRIADAARRRNVGKGEAPAARVLCPQRPRPRFLPARIR
jgi:hypothetical protein